MIFKPELVDLVLTGRKTETRRPMSDNPNSPWWSGRCGVKIGQSRALQPGRGKPAVARIRILDVQAQVVGCVTTPAAIAEGFESRRAFLDYWRALYGGELDPGQAVWAITFELDRATLQLGLDT